MRIKFDSHLHIGHSYYGKRAKSEVIFTSASCLEYFEKEQITHCNCFYTPESLPILKEVMEKTKTIVYPYKWISHFDGRETEKFDPEFDKGIKLHPIRTHDGKSRDLNEKIVKKWIKENIPEQTPIVIHTQDVKFEKETSFYNVMKLAQEFPNHKFVIAHAGSAGPASRLPGADTVANKKKDAVKFIGTYIVDSALVFGALQCSYMMKNVYCDLSSLNTNSLKIHILGQNPQFLEKVMLGADKPYFGAVGLKDEENQFRKYFGFMEVELEELHKRALRWLYEDQVSLDLYTDNYNSVWLDNVVRTKTRWSYKPRQKKIV